MSAEAQASLDLQSSPQGPAAAACALPSLSLPLQQSAEAWTALASLGHAPQSALAALAALAEADLAPAVQAAPLVWTAAALSAFWTALSAEAIDGQQPVPAWAAA